MTKATSMTTFLHNVAEFVLANYANDLKDCCIVFPNRRSAVYFFEEVKRINHRVIWLPKHCTIDEFIHSIVNEPVAMPITLLSELYLAHKELTKSEESFDKFFQWAQVILSDFEDIDKYLVDARALLQNIQDIKELNSNIDYLTEEQRRTIEHFFNVTLNTDDKSELKKRFLSIWRNLLPMYENFNLRLKKRNVTYNGAVYRKAAQMIGEPGAQLPYSKYIFVGFNAITRAEEHIFKTLQQQGKALFFWDYDESYITDEQHEAGRFLRRYAKEFKEPEGYTGQHSFDFKSKNIKIIASPTESGQLYAATQRLKEIPSEEMSQTAMVLSDETLLTSALESVAPYLSSLNVTMGYAIKNSIAGHWIELLLQLQSNKREHRGEMKFYFKNVLAVLQHPFFMSVCEQYATETVDKIREEAIFQIPLSLFESNDFAKLVFQFIDNQTKYSEYLLDVLKTLMRHFATQENDNWIMQQELVYRLTLQIQQLDSELKAESLEMDLTTYYQLLRRYLNSSKVPFEGEPISGLQVMGFLETRNVDPKNLIILNVNEDTIPANGDSPTFVPHNMRRAFGLPTRDDREAMYAYYFYRLLQRAENVTLTYFTGQQDGKKGECSRYIMQLIYGDYNVKEEPLQSNISFAANELQEIKKSNQTIKQLGIYFEPDSEGKIKALSPSSIVTYMRCPVMFYFSKVLRLSVNEEIDESIDSRVFGNIFHKAAEGIYRPFVGKGAVSSDAIKSISKDFIKNQIDKAFAESLYPFNKELIFSKIDSGEIDMRTDLKNEQRIIYDVIGKYVSAMLKYDADIADANGGLEFVSLEKSYYMPMNIEIGGKQHRISIGGTIDRVDKCGGAVRIVDYKTGPNEIVANSFDAIFDPELIHEYKGALQTLIYCMTYDYEYPGNLCIEPYLYKTTLFKKGESFLIHTKTPKGEEPFFEDGNYSTVKEQVADNIQNIVTEIFNPETPFIPTNDLKTCGHCDFSYFCNKRF